MKKYEIRKNGIRLLIIAAANYYEVAQYIRKKATGRIPENIKIYQYFGNDPAQLTI